MGWCSGSVIADKIEDLIMQYVPKDEWLKVTTETLNVLRGMDWDSVEEVDLFYWAMLENMKKDSPKYWDEDDEQQLQELREDLEIV
jgi:hypothetical protein